MSNVHRPILNAWFNSPHQAQLTPHLTQFWTYGVQIHPDVGVEVVEIIAEKEGNTNLSSLASVATRADTQMAIARKGLSGLWTTLLANPHLHQETFNYISKRLKAFYGRNQRLPKNADNHLIPALIRTSGNLGWVPTDLLKRCVREAYRHHAGFGLQVLGIDPKVAAPFKELLADSRGYRHDARSELIAVQALTPTEARKWMKDRGVDEDNRRLIELIMTCREVRDGTASMQNLWKAVKSQLTGKGARNSGYYPRVLAEASAILSRYGYAEHFNHRTGLSSYHPELVDVMKRWLKESQVAPETAEREEAADGKYDPHLAVALWMNGIEEAEARYNRDFPGIAQLAEAHWVPDEALRRMLESWGRVCDAYDMEQLAEHRGFTMRELVPYATPDGLTDLNPGPGVSEQVLIDTLNGSHYWRGKIIDHAEWLKQNEMSPEFKKQLEAGILAAGLPRLDTAGCLPYISNRVSELINDLCGAEAGRWEMLFQLSDAWEDKPLGELLDAVSAVTEAAE